MDRSRRSAMYDPVGLRQLDPFTTRAMIRLPEVDRLDPSPPDPALDLSSGPPVTGDPPPRAVES
jgi:hypothetical protein